MRKIILTVVTVTFATFCLNGQDNREKYLAGVNKYNEGNYAGASEIWTQLYKAGYDGNEVLYNIGNAFFKMNELPHAILFYERALLRNPGDEDIRYNLAIASGSLKDRFETIPQIFFIRWFDRLALSLTSDAWAITSAALFVVSLTLALVFLFISNYNLKLLAFWFAILLFLLSILSLTLAFRSDRLVYKSQTAIVLSPVLTGRSTPSEGGTELFVIHEGLKVKTGEQIGEWTEIRLPDGNKGWIMTSAIETI
jgi:hypothetical protein